MNPIIEVDKSKYSCIACMSYTNTVEIKVGSGQEGYGSQTNGFTLCEKCKDKLVSLLTTR